MTTTEFHNRDTVEVSGWDETESLDLCLAAEDGYAEDRLSLDSNTVAVDWDREGGNIVVFDNRSVTSQRNFDRCDPSTPILPVILRLPRA